MKILLIPRQSVAVLLISFFGFFACKKKESQPVSTTVPVINQLPGDNDKSVGASAKEFLSASKPSLVIEINYMKGFALQQASIDNLTAFLRLHLHKPAGIQVMQREIPASSKDRMTVEEVRAVEKNVRLKYSTSDIAAIHFLITNTSYVTENVLGIAYRNTSLCLFGKTIHANSGGLGQASRIKVESTVLNHEVGHLLGLTNIGTPMVATHNDPSHKEHCNNTDCLMYYAAETTDILGLLLTGNIPGLDQNCADDLRANGGK